MSLDRESCDEDMAMSKMSLSDNYSIEYSDNLKNAMTSPSEYVDLPLLHANFEYVEK